MMPKEISAGIIIYRKTIDGPRFLVLYHGRNYWNFPKGKIESEERSFQTAIREVFEETGITKGDLLINPNFKAYEKFTFWRKEGVKSEKVYKIVIFYLGETKKKSIRISDLGVGQPQEGFAWLTFSEAQKILIKHKDSQRILRQAYNFLQKKKVPAKSYPPRPRPAYYKPKTA